MNDLISRKALIAEYDRVHVGPPGGARKLMEDAPAAREWIPVTERLPETFGEYIVAVQAWEEAAGNLYADYADYDPYVKRWKTGLYLGVRDKVTHWMPLPEPPKEGE